MRPFDVILTPRKCVVVIFVVVCSLYFLLSPFVTDLSVDRDNEHVVPLGDIKFEADSVADGISNEVYTKTARLQGDVKLGKDFKHVHWFVQISDVHLSLFYDEGRATDLLQFCQQNLDIIRPEVVLLTGDITDAKHADKEGSMQFQDEWKRYDEILRESGILEKTVWLDTRGNHDAFDVPSLSSNKNYFKIYSPRGKLDSLSYHYVHQTSDGDQISFISVDACPNPGPKRPFNFFGLVSESEFDRLKEFVSSASASNLTVFFGHYPTSTIGSPHPGIRQLIGHGSVYLCGHLHTMAGFVPNMYAVQQNGYLELELADWKDARFYRLMAVDHGLISFVDLDFRQWPVILVTNPKNAQFLIPEHEPTDSIEKSSHVRILIFSKGHIETVVVEIDGMNAGEVEHVQGPLFVVAWQPSRYAEGLHTIRVSVKDSVGSEAEVLQPFSIDLTRPKFDLKSRFLLMSDHAKIFKVVFGVVYAFAFLPLLIVKLIRIRLQAMSSSRVTSCLLRFLLCWVRRFYLICSTPKVYYPLIIYNVYLLLGPWFVGEILEGQVGACFLFGLFVMQTYIPGSLTYLYGAFQLVIFNIPLTLYLGRCLDLSLASNKDPRSACSSRWLWRLAWLFDHSFFVIIITVQLYLVTTGFYRAYGLMALVLCPLRTWAVLLALYLRKQALMKGTSDSVSSSAREFVEQNQHQQQQQHQHQQHHQQVEPVTRPLVSDDL